MRLCPRCDTWKPDASFLKHGKWGGKTWERCLHCRTIPLQIPGASSVPLKGPERIAPTLHAQLLRSIARGEREAFLARGGRIIERPYVKTPSGVVFRKGRHKSRFARAP